MKIHFTLLFLCAGFFAGTNASLAQSCGGNPIEITASNGSICAGETLTITVSGNFLNNVTVNQGSNGNPQTFTLGTGPTSYTITPTASTTITVTNVSTTLFNPCVPAPGSVLSVPVSVTPLPGVPTVPTSTISYCRNVSAAPLSTSATTNVSGGTLTFYNAPTGGAVVPGNTIPSTTTAGSTTYYVSQKAGPNCEGPRAPITITTLELPVLSITPATASVCAGNSITLTASGATTYSWAIASGPGPLGSPSNTASMTVMPTTTTTYIVTGTGSNGCISTLSRQVSVFQAPVISIVNGTSPTACGTTDGQITFTTTNLATGSYTVTFTQNGTPMTGTLIVNGSTGTLSGLGGGSYGAFSLSQGGCTSAVAPGPVVLTSPGSPAAPMATTSTPVACTGETIQLSATTIAGATYVWTGPAGYSSTDQNASRINADVTFSGTYSVTATVSGCPSLPATVEILVKPVPTIDIISPQTICSGEEFAAVQFSGTDQTEFDFRNPDASTMPLGLAASGSAVQGISGFVGTNNGSAPVSNTITVNAINTANSKRCEGDSTTFVLTVNPGPVAPTISTSAPMNPCAGLMFQNFNASTSGNGPNTTYMWTTTGGAVVYAGANSPNALISFPQAGAASVKLTVNTSGTGCPAIKVWSTNVQSGTPLQSPQVVLVNSRLVCLLNTVNSYQWGYDDAQRMPVTLNGETGQDYLPAGGLNSQYNYWVMTYQGSNGCFQKTYYNKPASVTGTGEIADRMRAYPNPATSVLRIELPQSFKGSTQLEATDMAGHRVINTVITSVTTDLNVSVLPPGNYFLRCTNENGGHDLIRFIRQ